MDTKDHSVTDTGSVLHLEQPAAQVVHVEKVTEHDIVDAAARGQDSRAHYRSIQFIGTVLAQCLAQMSGYLSFNVPANILDLINDDLGGGDNVNWVAVVWTLGFAVGLPLVGRLSDIFGRRWFYVSCTALAVVGNIVASQANSMNMLIGGTVIVGLSAAGQLSFNVVLGELVAMKDRGPFNALVLFTSTPFSIFAPLVARKTFLYTAQKWRWIYYIGIMINAVSTALWVLFYHPPSYQMLNTSGRSRMTALRGLDWFGMFLFTAGLTVFLIGLNWGGVAYPWKSPAVLCTILLGFATLAVFCVWESFTPSEAPYIPMKLFTNLRYDALVVCASIGAMIYYAGTVLWPYVIADLWFTDEMTVGYWSCFMGGGLITGQVLGGLGHKYIPRMKFQMMVATIIQVPFVTALSASNQDSLGRSCAFIFLGALASGYIETLSLSSIALVWDASDIGLVACVMGCLRTAAGAIATSMYVSVLNNEVAKYVPEYITRAALAAGLPEKSLTALLEVSGTGNFTDVPGINTQIIDAVIVATKSGYARSFKTVFLITLPFGAIMLVAAMLTPNVEQYLTSEVARKMHNPRTQESDSKQGITGSSCA